jgi:hypothetical protein
MVIKTTFLLNTLFISFAFGQTCLQQLNQCRIDKIQCDSELEVEKGLRDCQNQRFWNLYGCEKSVGDGSNYVYCLGGSNDLYKECIDTLNSNYGTNYPSDPVPPKWPGLRQKNYQKYL